MGTFIAAFASELNPGVTPGVTPLLPVRVPGRTQGISPWTAMIPITERKILVTLLPLASVYTYERDSGAGRLTSTGYPVLEARIARTPARWPERSPNMSDVTRRVSRWKAKFSPDIAAQTTSRIFADMTERYEAAVVALSSMETQTKQVLDASGIDTMYIVFYLDFARQLFRLSHGRSISGPTLAKEAQVLLEKWQARGLKPEVLAAIRTDVFNVPAPEP